MGEAGGERGLLGDDGGRTCRRGRGGWLRLGEGSLTVSLFSCPSFCLLCLTVPSQCLLSLCPSDHSVSLGPTILFTYLPLLMVFPAFDTISLDQDGSLMIWSKLSNEK